MKILGVKIDEINKTEAINKTLEFLNSDKQHKIFTPNPEMLVSAQKDEYFKKILNNGDLNLCDGVGLSLVTGIKRITGIDFMLEICRICADRGAGIYLLGSGNDDVIKKTVRNLQKSFPDLKIVGFHKGLDIILVNETMEQCDNEKINYDNLANDEIVEAISKSKADILFVAFGHGKQEKWIYENLAKMPSVKIAMGVGGAFDYVSGHVRRAPAWMRRMGLEWLFRLVLQPWRIGRIFKAGVIFPFYLKFHK